MKKNYLVIFMIMMIIILTSCAVEDPEVKDRILAPENMAPPIKGKWTIEKVIKNPNINAESGELKDLVDKQALFHKDAVVVGDQYVLEPSYKTRNVDLSDYLLYNYKIDTTDLEIAEEKADVISVLGEDKYFTEFIKYKEDEIIVFAEENFFFLKQQTDEISKEEIDRYINVERNIRRKSADKELESLKSGILLGIKTNNYDEMNQIEDWDYKTIWIQSNNRIISSVYEIEDLLVPRKKEFSSIDIERKDIDNSFKDKIKLIPNPISNKENELSSVNRNSRIHSPTILKNILYVGNEYISTEVINKSTDKKTLEVYSINNIDSGPTTILSDVLGENDLKSFREDPDNIENSDLGISLNEENFGLIRRNGYWIMKGRINYNNEGKELYEDYNIKTIPPKEIVGYDELPISWNTIKSRFPNATDAFISPNEDIIIIDTRNDLFVYPIQDNEILQEEIGRVKKNYNDTIVMAEWATGRYISVWEEEILKNNGELIEDE